MVVAAVAVVEEPINRGTESGMYELPRMIKDGLPKQEYLFQTLNFDSKKMSGVLTPSEQYGVKMKK